METLCITTYSPDEARTHASYMLSFAIRKTTQQLCVIPYAMYPLPNYKGTNANKSAHAFKANWFCCKENGTTRRAGGYLKQINNK